MRSGVIRNIRSIIIGKGIHSWHFRPFRPSKEVVAGAHIYVFKMNFDVPVVFWHSSVVAFGLFLGAVPMFVLSLSW